jgi:hypothetical protein
MRILWQWPFHDARKPEAAEGNPSLVRLSKTHATDRRSNETPILRIFPGRCVAVLWQPWDSKDFGRERPTWPQQQMRPQEAIAFEMTTSG